MEAKKIPENKSSYTGNMNYYHQLMRSDKWAITYKKFPPSEFTVSVHLISLSSGVLMDMPSKTNWDSFGGSYASFRKIFSHVLHLNLLYNDGDPLCGDDQSYIMDNVLNHHPDEAANIGAGLNYIMRPTRVHCGDHWH
ncbi:DNA-directed RNA polymerase [Forsythia ovata]|uniref:DNA-directed RNA polymerase n=1 Tax=Forsythia ovata TaxID=205694 RepID=A0ABD1SJX7_9LAMI